MPTKKRCMYTGDRKTTGVQKRLDRRESVDTPLTMAKTPSRKRTLSHDNHGTYWFPRWFCCRVQYFCISTSALACNNRRALPQSVDITFLSAILTTSTDFDNSSRHQIHYISEVLSSPQCP